MDVTVHIVLGNSLHDTLDTVNVDIVVGEVPAPISISGLSLLRGLSLTWWDIGDRQGCRRHRSDGHSLRSTECCGGHIPTGH